MLHERSLGARSCSTLEHDTRDIATRFERYNVLVLVLDYSSDPIMYSAELTTRLRVRKYSQVVKHIHLRCLTRQSSIDLETPKGIDPNESLNNMNHSHTE